MKNPDRDGAEWCSSPSDHDSPSSSRSPADQPLYPVLFADLTDYSTCIDTPQETLAMITPENSGASQLACDIVNAFFQRNGFKPLIRQLNQSSGYSAAAFQAELARIADREIKSANCSES